MIGNENYQYAQCTYSIIVEDQFGKKHRALDVRYPTEVYGGKVCFPVIDPNAQDEIGQMMNKFYNETLS